MTGGSGNDVFGFVVSESIRNMSDGLVAEPVHRISDFKQGEDKIHFYFSDDLLTSGSMNTANSDHIKKTAVGDLEWMYYHQGQDTKTMRINMNSQSWSTDDLQFITFTPTTPP